MLTEEEIIKERLWKLNMEIESARRMKRLGIDPLQALDSLVHTMLEAVRNSIKQEFPNLSKEEFNKKMREQLLVYDKKKRKM